MKQNLDIKICGLSTKEAVDAVIADGASHMGLIFFEKSPRHISLAQALLLSDHAGKHIKKVPVTVNADDTYLGLILEAVDADMLQLHGSETPARVAEVKRLFNLPVMKAVSIREQNDLEKIKPYFGIADQFLFDAKPPEGSDLPGGNGVAFNWEIMDQLGEDVPYMLSGGLNAGNVSEAVAQSSASAIDASSGVESAPGIKDIALIKEFLETCSSI